MLAGYAVTAVSVTLLATIVSHVESTPWLETCLALILVSWMALAVVITPAAFVAFSRTRRLWPGILSISLVVPVLLLLLNVWERGMDAIGVIVSYPVRALEDIIWPAAYLAFVGFSFAAGARFKHLSRAGPTSR
jgi:hypothetical protein